jgi:phosphatidylglycerophosphatase A
MLRECIWIVSGKFLGEAPRVLVVKVEFSRMSDPAVALALSFGLGLVPWMPGTFGAAGAFLLYPLIMPLPWGLQCLLALLLLWLGCVACGRAAKALGGDDPSVIVWDETVGMLITLVLVPATPLSWLMGFLAFRILDINKPWLIGTAERKLRGGVAIMADDALAGLAAAGVVWVILAIITRLTTG